MDLINGVASSEGIHIVRSNVVEELEGTAVVVDFEGADVVTKTGFHGYILERLKLARILDHEDADEHVTVVSFDVRCLDSKVLGERGCSPSTCKGMPGFLQSFNQESSKIGLDELLDVLTEINVELIVERDLVL